MKRFLSFSAGVIVGGLVFGVLGTFFGHSLALTGQPVVVARNVTNHIIPQLKLETDIGESHTVSDIPSHQSRRIEISGRDKSLWIVANLPDGKELTSEKIYVTSRGFVFVTLSDDAIELDYEL